MRLNLPCWSRWLLGFALCAALLSGRTAFAASPFVLVPTLVTNAGRPVLQLQFRIPEGHRLYAEKLEFQLLGSTNRLTFRRPPPQSLKDRFSGQEKKVFPETFTAEWILPARRPDPLSLVVQLQGCNTTSCFFPEVRQFDFGQQGEIRERPESEVECEHPPGRPHPGRSGERPLAVAPGQAPATSSSAIRPRGTP
jgi:thiol:disulfide interchange protein